MCRGRRHCIPCITVAFHPLVATHAVIAALVVVLVSVVVVVLALVVTVIVTVMVIDLPAFAPVRIRGIVASSASTFA